MFISHLTPRQKAELGRLTVDQALDRWQRLYAIGRKPQTLKYHLETLATIRAHWPDIQAAVADVSDAQCMAFTQRVAHFSAPRFNAMVNTLRSIIPEMACVPRRRVEITPKNVPTLKEFDALLAALDTCAQGNAALAVRFLAFTGLRINEARRLRWKDVRDDHLFLPGEITKSGKPRCVPFIPGAAEVIARLRAVNRYHMKSRDGKTREGFVFPQTTCQRALRFACRLAGFPRFSHHTFRHYFATRCILSGVDVPTVAKWLGHSDNGALLLRIYCHLLDDHSLQMAQKVKVAAKNQEAAAFMPEPDAGNIVPLVQPAPVAASPQSPENGSANSRSQLQEAAA